MVDLLARMVVPEAWRNLLQMPCAELRAGMEARGLRDLRPEADGVFERGFDVDLEAEVLDWVDYHKMDGDQPLLAAVGETLQSGGEPERLASGLWHLSDWTSPGAWRCMEGRGFLYLEPYCGVPMDGVERLYEEATWRNALAEIGHFTAEEYSEAVVLDWMGRRQDLGETLNEKQDSRILSTMQSHRRHATALHRLAGLVDGDGVVLLVNREWHSLLTTGFEEFNLGALLSSGWKEDSND